MTTLASPSLPLPSLVAAVRRSRLAALTVAVVSGLSVLVLGSAAVDAEMGIEI